MGRTFVVRIRTENPDQASFCPFALRGVSVASKLAFGHLRYCLTDVPPQSNSPPDCVLSVGRPDGQAALRLDLMAERRRREAGVQQAMEKGPRSWLYVCMFFQGYLNI